MKLLRTAVASLVMLSAMPLLAHAQDRDRDHDRNNNAYVQDRDHDRDRDAARDQWRSNNAAYEDGWQHGMNDAQRHKKNHAKAGHWKHQDKDAFNDGYARGYQSYWVDNNRRDRDHDHDRDHR